MHWPGSIVKPRLLPLFSPAVELVGWLQPGKYIFTPEMRYVAFIASDSAWTATSTQWIGPVVNSHIYDTDGRAVAFSPGLPVPGIGTPFRPMRPVPPMHPLPPIRPLHPRRPLGVPDASWSSLTFLEWLIRFEALPDDSEDEQAAEATAEQGSTAPPE
jgi:hypothetical protein